MASNIALICSPSNPLLLPNTAWISATDLVAQMPPISFTEKIIPSAFMIRTPLPTSTDAEEIAASAARARRLIALRTEHCVLYPHPYANPTSTQASNDVPVFARLALIDAEPLATDPADTLIFSGQRVFRHYTVDEHAQERIIRDKSLIPISRSFQDGDPGVSYRQLVGAFLTTPACSPFSVGVSEDRRHWVDVRLPSGTGLLALNSGERDWCYMVPGIPVNLYSLSVYCAWKNDWKMGHQAALRIGLQQLLAYARAHTFTLEAALQLQDTLFTLEACIRHYREFLSLREHNEMIPQYSRIPVEVVGSGVFGEITSSKGSPTL